jgi:hypothetical protein
MLSVALALVLVTPLPSASRTSWMRLESFRLTIGMPRQAAIDAIKPWNPKKGKDENEVFILYGGGDKAVTLGFRNDRLQSVRFELFAFLADTRKAFDEEKGHLRESRGAPPKSTRSILIYDNALPNLMVVLSDDPNTQAGKQGLGMLAIRYYDPR